MKSLDMMLNVFIRLFKFLIFLGIMIFSIAGLLAMNAEAAEYTMGPGDSYDAEGNIVALDGTIVVKADGTIVKDAFKSTSSYAVIGYTSGDQTGVPREIIAGTDSAAAASSTAGKVINEAAARSQTAKQDTAATVQQAASTAAAAAGSISNNNVTGSGADAVYSFEGKKYRKASLYGTQKLTGYSAEEVGTAETYSGKTAAAYHTVAAPSNIPLGTVIIVEGKSGPYASRYNGVYVVEDRGGYTLESQGIIDIFCNTAAESDAVTSAGWNYADIYIAEAVQ